jgi:hypothetical protein
MGELKFNYQSAVKDGNIQDSVWMEIRRDLKEFEGLRVELTIRKKRKSTSVGQRGYYWGCIVSAFQQGALDMWGEEIDKQTAHENLKQYCNYKELVSNDGEVTKILLSTKNFDTLQTEDYYDRCRKMIYNFFNIVVPLPNEQAEMFN